MANKVVVFGIDGGTLSLIEQWKDDLPTFRRIMEAGVYGDMLSTVPALTCPAWPCMFTGKNPGKIGMYDFLSLELNGIKPRVMDSTDYHTMSLWKTLNSYGKKVGLLNVPITYPPHKVDGFMVCGIGAPETAGIKYTYPPELKSELNQAVGGYEITPSVLLTLYNQEDKCLRNSEDVLKKRVRAAKYLINHYPCDFFACVFFTSDVVQHYFWRHMDTSHPKHIADSKYKNVVKDFYKKIDQSIGELIMELSADTNIIIASDHGFGACYGGFSLNKWLEQNGYLKFNRSMRWGNINVGLRSVRNLLLAHLSPQLVHRVAKLIPQGVVERISASGEGKDNALNLYHNADWGKTRAYAVGTATGGIYIVGQGNEGLRDEIISKLSSLGFRSFKKEEIYWGRYAESAPDISIELGSSKYYPKAYGETLWIDYAVSGSHIPQGMFMACGPEIEPKGRLSNLSIYDVAPTILQLMNVPIPEDMDGRVLSEIFKPTSDLAKQPVIYSGLNECQRIISRISQLKASGKI